MENNKTKVGTGQGNSEDQRAHWASIFPRIPLWMLAITLAIFLVILIERLYISHAPMTLFGASFGPTESGELMAPAGSVLIWTRKDREYPRGWSPCDGTNDTPNLDGKFLMGVAARNRIGETGGTVEIEFAGAHSHTGTTESVKLPDHGVPCSGNCAPRTTNHAHTFATTENGAHTHGENRPPYFGVVFLCRT